MNENYRILIDLYRLVIKINENARRAKYSIDYESKLCNVEMLLTTMTIHHRL